jgi:S1-C subfamily serine protease
MRINFVAALLVICIAVLHHVPPSTAADDDLMESFPVGQALQGPPATASDLAMGRFVRELPDGARISTILRAVDGQEELSTRGAKEAALYRAVSPAVVLVVSDKGLGSGSVIADGNVLTNFHVIAGAKEVAIAFKPLREGDKPKPADLVPVRIIKVDQVADLAMLEFEPGLHSVKPMELGTDKDIEVGDDVSAIGHPTGQAWTYTRGVISQFRRGFEWTTEDHIAHRADVIQTQTPINPGNSGGPLLSEDGHLIGVNAFKAEGEGLNFAVSVGDVRKFVAATTNRVAASAHPQQECTPKMLYDGRTKDNTGHVRVLDAICSGKADMDYFVPDDVHRSIRLRIDTNGDGKPDVWIYDADRDGKWDYSLYATKRDGKIDLIGYHPDGALKASRYEQYHGQPTPWAN